MKLQLARVAKAEATVFVSRYRGDLPPVFVVEAGPDLEDRIALHEAELVAQGFDPEDSLIIILNDIPKPASILGVEGRGFIRTGPPLNAREWEKESIAMHAAQKSQASANGDETHAPCVDEAAL